MGQATGLLEDFPVREPHPPEKSGLITTHLGNEAAMISETAGQTLPLETTAPIAPILIVFSAALLVAVGLLVFLASRRPASV